MLIMHANYFCIVTDWEIMYNKLYIVFLFKKNNFLKKDDWPKIMISDLKFLT